MLFVEAYATILTPGGTDRQRGDVGRSEQPDLPVDLKIERRPGVVLEVDDFAEVDAVLVLRGDVEGPLVDGRWRPPVVEIEGIALLEEDRELTALGAEPEAVLAAERVHVGVVDARGDGLPADPAEAQAVRAFGRTGHDPALEVRVDRDLGLAGGPLEHDDLGVGLKEGQVVLEQDAFRGLGRFRAGRGQSGDDERRANAVSHGSLLPRSLSPPILLNRGHNTNSPIFFA